MRPWIIVLVAAGCGRVGFGETPPADAEQPIDAPIEAPPPCPPTPGVIFCESFEDTVQLGTSAGTVEIDGARAYRGARSQHAQTTMVSEASWQLGGVLPYVAGGDLYVRWYVYIPSSVGELDLASVHLVQDMEPFAGVIYGFRAGAAEVTSSESDVTAFSPLVVARDRWVCAQMHVQIAEVGGAIDGALDGQPITPVTGIDTLPANGFRNVHSGLFATGPSSGRMEIWTDELAVGTLPIPCD